MSVVPYTRLGGSTQERSTILMNSLRIPPFSLPDGTELAQADPLVTTAECLFQAPAHSYRSSKTEAAAKSQSSSSSNPEAKPTPWCVPTLATLIKDCIFHAGIDADVRRELMGNILIVGGGSLIDGVANRLVYELTQHLGATKADGTNTSNRHRKAGGTKTSSRNKVDGTINHNKADGSISHNKVDGTIKLLLLVTTNNNLINVIKKTF